MANIIIDIPQEGHVNMDAYCYIQGSESHPKPKTSQHRSRRNSVKVWTTPYFLHQWMPYVLSAEILLMYGIGCFIALPSLYSDYVYFHQVIATFLLYQLLSNWFFMHITDTSFNESNFPKIAIGSFPYEVPESIKKNVLMPIVESHSITSRYPYWQWAPCLTCQWWRPARCHHCKLCGKCVLKRDHHCFFARKCIGLKNFRYFFVFLFYSCLTTTYSCLNGLNYIWTFHWEKMSVIDLLPGVSFVKTALGYNLAFTGAVIVIGWVLMAMTYLCFTHLIISSNSLFSGNTPFEIQNNIDVIDSRDVTQKINSIFGHFWIFYFIFPLPYSMSPADEDPYNWRSLRPPKRKKPLIEITIP